MRTRSPAARSSGGNGPPSDGDDRKPAAKNKKKSGRKSKMLTQLKEMMPTNPELFGFSLAKPPHYTSYNSAEDWWEVDFEIYNRMQTKHFGGAMRLLDQCIVEYEWTRSKAVHVLKMYRQFLRLLTLLGDWNCEMLLPPIWVEQMWSMHRKDMGPYIHDMELLCEGLVIPPSLDLVTSSEIQQRKDWTLHLANEQFGNEVDQESWAWGTAARAHLPQLEEPQQQQKPVPAEETTVESQVQQRKPAAPAARKKPPAAKKKKAPKEFPVGFLICKKFGEYYYSGEVVSPEPKTIATGQLVWRVEYEDGDAEELTREELLSIATNEDAMAEMTRPPRPVTPATTEQGRRKRGRPAKNHGTAQAQGRAAKSPGRPRRTLNMESEVDSNETNANAAKKRKKAAAKKGKASKRKESSGTRDNQQEDQVLPSSEKRERCPTNFFHFS